MSGGSDRLVSALAQPLLEVLGGDVLDPVRVTAERQVTLLTDELIKPNGLAFSPDESVLYVSQSDPDRAVWMRYPVKKDGTLAKGEVFQDVSEHAGRLPGLPDGFKVDRRGNLFATGPGGKPALT